SRPILAPWFSAPSFRATCASPKRRVSACRSSCTTRIRVAPWPTFPWPVNCCGAMLASPAKARIASAKQPPMPVARRQAKPPLRSRQPAKEYRRAMAAKKRGLGRGLEALLAGSKNVAAAPEVPVAPVAAPQAAAEAEPVDGSLKQLPIEFIQPGKYQPRVDMRPEALEELADSIRSQGVMQPIVVRPLTSG